VPFVRFAGAVGVNVLANLIAAGIIYLFGQWFGFFPSRPVAIFAAVIFVVLAVQFLGLGLTIYFRREGRAVLAEAISVSISAVMVLLTLFWVRYDNETGWRIAFSALVLVSGAAFVASALALGKAWRDSRAAREPEGSPHAESEVL
jgi:hypothetical protein